MILYDELERLASREAMRRGLTVEGPESFHPVANRAILYLRVYDRVEQVAGVIMASVGPNDVRDTIYYQYKE